MTMKTGRTTPDRILSAWVAASAAGGAVVGLELFVSTLWPHLQGNGMFGGLAEAFGMAAALASISALYAAIVYAVGLLLVGGPAWLALHRLGVRARWAAALAGALLSNATAALLVTVFDGTQFGWDELRISTFLLLPGAVAGWVLHRVAYGKASAKP